jgi:hypothetical protein
MREEARGASRELVPACRSCSCAYSELRIGCASRGLRRVGPCGYVHENIMHCIL